MNKLYLAIRPILRKAKSVLKNERGDTNIIAIIIILAIVIALAVVFRNSLMNLFNKIWGSLFNSVDNAL